MNKKSDQYLEELYKAYDYATKEFDKSLTYISSGILAISFAFIDNIVPLKKATDVILLFYGWYILIGAIGLSIISHYINILILKKIILNYQEKDDVIQKSLRNVGESFVQALNIIIMVLIFVGGFCILKFLKYNLM